MSRTPKLSHRHACSMRSSRSAFRPERRRYSLRQMFFKASIFSLYSAPGGGGASGLAFWYMSSRRSTPSIPASAYTGVGRGREPCNALLPATASRCLRATRPRRKNRRVRRPSAPSTQNLVRDVSGLETSCKDSCLAKQAAAAGIHTPAGLAVLSARLPTCEARKVRMHAGRAGTSFPVL